jgi:hypothetical protein
MAPGAYDVTPFSAHIETTPELGRTIGDHVAAVAKVKVTASSRTNDHRDRQPAVSLFERAKAFFTL